jgi:hypothetical protein
MENQPFEIESDWEFEVKLGDSEPQYIVARYVRDDDPTGTVTFCNEDDERIAVFHGVSFWKRVKVVPLPELSISPPEEEPA